MSEGGRPELLALAENLAARAEGDERIEVFVARGESTAVRAYGGEIEEHRHGATAGVGVRVVAGPRQGFAWGGSLDPEVVEEVLAQARENVAFAEPDEAVGLVRDDGVAPPDLDLAVADLGRRSADDKRALALELERRILAADPRITGVRIASYADGRSEGAVANSEGLSAWSEGTSASLSASVLAADGDETRIAYSYDAARDPDELDLDAVVAEAVERATALLGAKKPASTRLPVLLDRRVAASFLGLVAGTLTGDRVAKGRSPFADRLGEQIASSALTLVDDPTDPRHLGADTHDGEGIASRRNVLIERGVLQRFLHDGTSARRTGSASTGSAVRGTRSTPTPGVRALQVEPGARSPDRLIAGLERGLIVVSVSGLHSGVNPVSGDFSVGIEGLMIRDGELAEPVKEATIASTLQRMLLDLTEVGDDLAFRGGGDGGASLLVGDLALSGV